MTIEQQAKDAVAEGAGLIIAQVAGDNDLINAVLMPMWEDRDARAAVRTLRAVLVAAGQAMQVEVDRANEADEPSPAAEKLIALSRVNYPTGPSDDH